MNCHQTRFACLTFLLRTLNFLDGRKENYTVSFPLCCSLWIRPPSNLDDALPTHTALRKIIKHWARLSVYATFTNEETSLVSVGGDRGISGDLHGNFLVK